MFSDKFHNLHSRFFVPLQTYQFSISVHNCSHGNSSTCPVSIATRGGGLPGLGNTSVRSDCTGDSCDVSVLKAEPGIWNYLEVRSKADSFLTAQLKIEFSGKNTGLLLNINECC